MPSELNLKVSLLLSENLFLFSLDCILFGSFGQDAEGSSHLVINGQGLCRVVGGVAVAGLPGVINLEKSKPG